LFHDGNVQLLLRNQRFHISTPERRRHGDIEQGLVESAAADAECFYPAFTGPMAVLKTGRHTQFRLRPGNGAKDKSLPSGLLQTGFRFLDRRIFFQCRLENCLERYGVGCVRETNHENRHQELNNSG
jgi:hypothetical protein